MIKSVFKYVMIMGPLLLKIGPPIIVFIIMQVANKKIKLYKVHSWRSFLDTQLRFQNCDHIQYNIS